MTIPLSETFAFSQSSLQAYVDCPRRFWLTYVEQLPWPAVQAGPVEQQEQQMRHGAAFHRLIQRRELGIDPILLAQGLTDPLDRWFADYLRHRPSPLPTSCLEVERVLSIPFGAYRLAAQFDLIAAEPGGRVVIVDWKTNARRPQPHHLRQKMQSVVYPFLLVEASHALPWGPVAPNQVELCYWFSAAPQQPILFTYDSERHAAARLQLERLVAQILAGSSQAEFPKVPDSEQNRSRFCSYCVYRSRCDRGIGAGLLDRPEEEGELFAPDPATDLAFTLDEVEEMAF